MNTETIIAAGQDGRVYFIGEEALKYVRAGWSTPFAYPPGRLEKGDILIYLAQQSAQGQSVCEALGILPQEGDWQKHSPQGSIEQKSGLQDIGPDRGFLIISGIDSEGARPLIKPFSNDDVKVIDTIYERKSIVVTKTKTQLVVSVDGQRCSWHCGNFAEAALLADDDGIKFFTPERTAKISTAPSVAESFADILKRGYFPGYCDASRIRTLSLNEVLAPEIGKAVAKGKSVVQYRGAGVWLESQETEVQGRRVFILSLKEEEALIKTIADENARYARLKAEALNNSGRQMQYGSFRLWGAGEKMKTLQRLLQKGSATNATILLTGESGTGKTFLAREIHNCSKRRGKPFVHINCAAIPYQLLESELFGYEEGAFSGARRGGKAGLLDMAFGGTLFLDEIGELSLSLQGKLLEVMQSRTYYQVGGTKKHTADVRFIAATNRNLLQLVKEKRFRKDLYYRINVFPVEIPPLRERAETIRAIVSDILPEICARLEIEPLMIDYQALEKMKTYPWPGNIRELENILEKAAILCDKKVILAEDLLLPEDEEATVVKEIEPRTLRERREACEKQAIIEALALFCGDKQKAASYLDIGRTAIFDKVKKYGIADERKIDDDFR